MYRIKLSDNTILTPSFTGFSVQKKRNEGRLATTYELGKLTFFGADFEYLYAKMIAYNYSVSGNLQKDSADWLPIDIILIPSTFDWDKKVCECELVSNNSTKKIIENKDTTYDMFSSDYKTNCLIQYNSFEYIHTRVHTLLSILNNLIHRADPTVIFDSSSWAGLGVYGNSAPGSPVLLVSALADFILTNENTEPSNSQSIYNMTISQWLDYFWELWNVDWYIDNTNTFRTIHFPDITASPSVLPAHDLTIYQGYNFSRRKNVLNIEEPAYTRLQRELASKDIDFKGVDVIVGNGNTDPGKPNNKKIVIDSISTDVADIQARKQSAYPIESNRYVLLHAISNNYTPINGTPELGLYMGVDIAAIGNNWNVKWEWSNGYFEFDVDNTPFIKHIVLRIDVISGTTPILFVGCNTIEGYISDEVPSSSENGPIFFEYGFNDIPASARISFVIRTPEGQLKQAVLKLSYVLYENSSYDCGRTIGTLSGEAKSNCWLATANIDARYGSRYPQKQMTVNNTPVTVDTADLDNFIQMEYDIPVLDVVNDYDFSQAVITDYSSTNQIESITQNFDGKPGKITLKTRW